MITWKHQGLFVDSKGLVMITWKHQKSGVKSTNHFRHGSDHADEHCVSKIVGDSAFSWFVQA